MTQKNSLGHDPKQTEMLHEALQSLLDQSYGIEGQLGNISLAVRYDARVGMHVHAAATVRHRITATISRDEKKQPTQADIDKY